MPEEEREAFIDPVGADRPTGMSGEAEAAMTTPPVLAKARRRRGGQGDDLSDAMAWTLNRFFRGRPIWHGSLWPHVADLTAQQALWRPTPQRHCVWEILRHIIFWRHWLIEHAAGRRIEDWKEQNWTLPEPADDTAWLAELRRLRSVQRSLTRLFRSTPSRTLLAGDAKGKFRRFWWVGVLAHDSYHTGQIALLRAMMGLKPID